MKVKFTLKFYMTIQNITAQYNTEQDSTLQDSTALSSALHQVKDLED